MHNIKLEFKDSLYTGFIDKEILSNSAYQPELLVNQKTPPKKILSTILSELSVCTEFYISVAFVTTSGVATIINQLKELEERNVKGYVLVSQYLNFTQPEALKRLMQFKNIELRIMVSGNAHAKGYIFKNNTHYNLIVGSSNLTANALSTNKEWNIKLSAFDESGLVYNVIKEFKADFDKATIVTLDYINEYEKLFQEQFLLNKKITEQTVDLFETIVPNIMQQEAEPVKRSYQLLMPKTSTLKNFYLSFTDKL